MLAARVSLLRCGGSHSMTPPVVRMHRQFTRSSVSASTCASRPRCQRLNLASSSSSTLLSSPPFSSLPFSSPPFSSAFILPVRPYSSSISSRMHLYPVSPFWSSTLMPSSLAHRSSSVSLPSGVASYSSLPAVPRGAANRSEQRTKTTRRRNQSAPRSAYGAAKTSKRAPAHRHSGAPSVSVRHPVAEEHGHTKQRYVSASGSTQQQEEEEKQKKERKKRRRKNRQKSN
mmetsp:Transcript_10699/g.27048  ORF Transcript_10699/g.27048 Transcript_10699/m.27048 type:complete len:229 (-) Transcript_10699:3-689(-)